MTRRARSPSSDPSGSAESSGSLLKRLKTTHAPDNSIQTNPDSFSVLADPTPHFANGLLEPQSVQRFHGSYITSEPFKYVVVEKLFQDDLLKEVKDEIQSELSFSEKETDIYKVHQTGDLASLSFLTPKQISLFPNLLTLRDALYSVKFRKFLQGVTGCGALSGIKQDMSVNTYKKGCHLLNHDDVIGTRRVSYILYMPLPHYQGWQKEWGGALELYATREGQDGVPEPEAIPAKTIPPSWNQFIFFEVQPGRSFHSVEEVVVGDSDEDGRQRLSISGWFHAAQEGEEGYESQSAANAFKSSRDQLTSTHTMSSFRCYPDLSFPYTTEPPLPSAPLSEENISFLSEFINPVYLQPRTMRTLAARFAEESSLELHSLLCAPMAATLQRGLRENDRKDGLLNGDGTSPDDRNGRVPPHWAGTSDNSRWSLKGPPHKWRYCVLKNLEDNRRSEAVSPRAALVDPDEIMRSLQDELFPSHAFRAWLASVSSLLPLRYAVEARRLRPGLDYTLATSEEREVRLDVVLGLTPDLEAEANANAYANESEGDVEEAGLSSWQSGEWGGWECYTAPHDEEDDPAVYRSSSSKHASRANRRGNAESTNENNEAAEHTNGHHNETTNGNQEDDEDMEEEDDGQDESGTLLTVQPGFNRLLLVLRDERVMHFVKYVSAAAEGSRWDVCGEYEVGMVQQEGD